MIAIAVRYDALVECPMAKLGFVIIGTTFWVLVILGIADDNGGLLGAAAVVGVISIGSAFAMTLTSHSTVQDVRRRIWDTGTPATATVLSSEANGAVNNDPRVTLRLQVTVPGQAPKLIETTQVISQIEVSRIQVGSTIAVKVDPSMPAVVVVDESLTPHGYGD
ncbi:MAG: hypothetical protein JWQ74_1848 [Marmoricola sp.]|nr:hypothetical protein [Marmoricola sp.]